MADSYLELENRTTHLNKDPGSDNALFYVVNGVPYVRYGTHIIGLKTTSTSNGVVTTPTTFTQTYSTADATLSAYTPNAQTSAFTGAADSEAKLTDLNGLRVAYENLRLFTEDLAKLVNSVIDNEQALGIAN